MYTYVYICVYTCIYIYTCISIYILQQWACVENVLCVGVAIYTCIYIYINIYIAIVMYIYMYIFIYIYIHLYLNIAIVRLRRNVGGGLSLCCNSEPVSKIGSVCVYISKKKIAIVSLCRKWCACLSLSIYCKSEPVLACSVSACRHRYLRLCVAVGNSPLYWTKEKNSPLSKFWLWNNTCLVQICAIVCLCRIFASVKKRIAPVENSDFEITL